jgi:hypothetical protein
MILTQSAPARLQGDIRYAASRSLRPLDMSTTEHPVPKTMSSKV